MIYYHIRSTIIGLILALFPATCLALTKSQAITTTTCSLVALLAASCIAAFFFFRWRNAASRCEDIEFFLPEQHGGATRSKGYYLKHLRSEHEEISPELKALFNLPKHVNSLSVLTGMLTDTSAAKLASITDKLMVAASKNVNDSSHIEQSFTFSAQTNATNLNEQKFFNIIASNVFAADGTHKGIILWFDDVTRLMYHLHHLKLENKRLKEDYLNCTSILNALPFPIWHRDKDLSLQYCNLAYTSLVSTDNNPTHVQQSLELSKQVRKLAKYAQESGKPQMETDHIIVNGQRRLYTISENPIANTASSAGFAYDITELEELTSNLERYEAAQACLLESSASGMALFGFDTKLKLYNNAYVKLWGLDEAWLQTQPGYSEILEALREKRKLPEQANFPAFKKQHLTLFTDLLEPHNEFFYLPDGTALRVIVIPHALGGLLFAYEDMTDKLAMERSYNTLIAVQRATLDNLHEGIAVFGQNGRLKLSNPIYAELWELDPKMLGDEPHISHILDHSQHLYRYGDNWQAFKEEIITQATNRQPIQQCFERTDGKVLEWISVPLPDGAILMTYLDVTDSTVVERSLRERNDALEAADRLKTEFLANVSYELRSPLTTIIGFTEILRTYFNQHLEEKEQGYLEAIYNSGQHLMAIINDILDLASIEAGFMKLTLSEFSISDMLNSISPLIRQRVKENNLTFKVKCSPETGNIIGDEIRIKQVIFKLISNAIKFSKPGGIVTIGADNHNNNEIVIWVKDEGSGIPDNEQQKIFEKFYKSATVRSNDSGTGLGLSVVKNFVQLHGGRIELKSEAGKGTTFFCYFKRQSQPATQANNALLTQHQPNDA